MDGITDFDKLPAAAREFVKNIEDELDVPVTMVSTGPERKKLILKEAKELIS